MSRQTILSLAVVLLAASLLSACGKDDEPASKADAKTATSTATVATAPPTTTKTQAPPETTASGCKKVAKPAAKDGGGHDKPKLRLDRERTYVAVLKTSCGRIDIKLDTIEFPKTTASFVSLARDGYFDDLTFHRISNPGGQPFVIQGGDPTGLGNGGPGYEIIEAPPADAKYKRGTVAMAKNEIQDAGTSESQFFIVTGTEAPLPPDYAILGRVTDGMDSVDKISEVPTDPTTEMPLEPVVITDIEIEDTKR